MAGKKNFARLQTMQFVPQLFIGIAAGKFRHRKFSRGDIGIRKSHGSSRRRPRQRRKIIIFLWLENIQTRRRARRNHAHHFAPHQLFPRAGLLHLIADGNLVTGAQQPRDVSLGGVIGNAAHGHGLPLFAISRCQRDLQFARRGDRVFVEKFVEVPQPEQNQHVRVPRLDRVILPHQRRGWFSHHSESAGDTNASQAQKVYTPHLRPCRGETRKA